MKSGDRCPTGCGGTLYVANSKPVGSKQVHYLACARCKQRPANNKVVIDAEFVRRRQRA